LYYLENPPQPLKPYPHDSSPQLTERLIALYRDNVLGGIDYEPAPNDRRKFIVASNKMVIFLAENRQKIMNGRQAAHPADRARWLWDAIVHDVGRDHVYNITPGYFGSDLTFSRRLPAYLSKEAIMGVREFKGLANRDITIPEELE
jgi:hypothetical protein